MVVSPAHRLPPAKIKTNGTHKPTIAFIVAQGQRKGRAKKFTAINIASENVHIYAYELKNFLSAETRDTRARYNIISNLIRRTIARHCVTRRYYMCTDRVSPPPPQSGLRIFLARFCGIIFSPGRACCSADRGRRTTFQTTHFVQTKTDDAYYTSHISEKIILYRSNIVIKFSKFVRTAAWLKYAKSLQ